MTASLGFAEHGNRGSPPLVLGNSLGTTSVMWSAQIAALAEHFHVLAVDHRGHGRSESPEPPWSIEDFGRDVVALLDKLQLERVAFAGVSLGGMVGMWLTANEPRRVDRLVLICTSAHLAAPDYWRQRAAKVRASGMAPIVDPVVDRWFTPSFARQRPHVVREYKEMLARSQPDAYAACCDAIARLDLRADLSLICAPTLVIAGADDEAILPEHGKAIAKAISGAAFAMVADAAHLANVEQPEAVTRLMLDHLRAKE